MVTKEQKKGLEGGGRGLVGIVVISEKSCAEGPRFNSPKIDRLNTNKTQPGKRRKVFKNL